MHSSCLSILGVPAVRFLSLACQSKVHPSSSEKPVNTIVSRVSRVSATNSNIFPLKTVVRNASGSQTRANARTKKNNDEFFFRVKPILFEMY